MLQVSHLALFVALGNLPVAAPALDTVFWQSSEVGGVIVLLGHACVKKELNITDAQWLALARRGDRIRVAHMQDYRDLAVLRDKPKEYADKYREVNTAVNNKLMKESAEVLSAKQVKRLRELALQVAVNDALVHPEVQAKLQLDMTQKDKLAAAHAVFARKQHDLRKKYGSSGKSVLSP
jgi:hypothetical protein